MNTNRGRLLFLALSVVDASWVFAAAATFGLLFGLGTSPLSWPVMIAVLGISMFAGWIAVGVRGDFITVALLQGGVGLIAVYMAVGLRSAEGVAGVEWSWLPRLVHGDLGQAGGAAAVIALLFAIFLWRRGLRAIADDSPWDSLHGSFRWGIAAIAVALIVEIIVDKDVGIRLIVFPFFAAALGGMALGRLAEPGAWGASNRVWGRVILGTVATVLALGLTLGLAGSAFGEGPVRGVGAALAAIRDGVFWLISIPLRYVVMAVFAIFQWLRNLFGSEEREPIEFGGGALQFSEQEVEEATDAVGSGLLETIVAIIAWPLAAIILLVVLYFLMKGLRKMRAGREEGPESERESIRGDANARKDLMDLLSRLLPGFVLRGRKGERILRFPTDEPGITEVFELYFQYLAKALRRGASLEPHLTPTELRIDLEEVMPGAPVALLTERFNAACYGHEPSGADVIRRLEHGLEDADEGSKRGGS